MSESLQNFPCEYVLKAVGRGEDFPSFVADVVRGHIPTLPEAATTSRASSGGRYLAVSVTFEAESQTQLDAIYTELARDSRLILTL